ncbi:hypothetical protein Tco_0931916, partial [Tanacetum coccineum]
RGSLTREVRLVLYELSEFIRILCARNTSLNVLEEQEAKIVVILCKLEKIFPESFFDMMIHLLIHLPSEVKKGGPPEYRWMFPFERKMRELKGYVKNNARPEGCIVQRYIDKECLTFCSMYLNDVDTIFNKVERNNEMVDFGGEISIFSCKGRPFGITEERVMSGTELGEIHTYILNNCPELKELENEHKAQLEAENNRNVNETHDKQFTYWLQQRVNDCQESSEIRVLSRGPLSMNRYSGCMVNGYRFHTKIREIDRKTQDSGIMVKGEYGEDIIDYYGILQEVLEVEYLGENKRVLVFKCDWFKVGDKKGLQVDRESAAISINMSRKWFKDQPYILASQAKQVFYVPDLKLGKHWYVVESSPPRKLFDVPVHELVDASTVRSSQKRHGIDEYSSGQSNIGPNKFKGMENPSHKKLKQVSGKRQYQGVENPSHKKQKHMSGKTKDGEGWAWTKKERILVSHTLIFCYIWAPTVLGKETRALGETRKSRLNKGSLVFEVDESFGRIIGKNSQGFITKGGCVMRKAGEKEKKFQYKMAHYSKKLNGMINEEADTNLLENPSAPS